MTPADGCRAVRLAALLLAVALLRSGGASAQGSELSPGGDAWMSTGMQTVRGLTIGPIESALHPGRGYGSAAYRESLSEARAMGANWVSITPFGRVWDLSP
ncbi:MAG TPA: hypothetical protein VK524_05055, partial [Polyangiaceae bacterium]|nr:hypothetical protein [Polyangiaceae bacterium]